jgi:hypothetical protein
MRFDSPAPQHPLDSLCLRTTWRRVKHFLGDCFVAWATAGRLTRSAD